MTASDWFWLIACMPLGAAAGYFLPFPFGIIAAGIIGFAVGTWRGRRAGRVILARARAELATLAGKSSEFHGKW